MIAPSLGNIQLTQAIKDHLKEVSMVSQLKFNVNTDHFSDNKLDQHIKPMLYRIKQEQINDIPKHAEARKVTILLEISKRLNILRETNRTI